MKTIVVGATSTPTAEDAAAQAAQLARELGARLHVVSAVTARQTTKVEGAGESWSFTSFDDAQTHMQTLRVALGEGFELTTAVVDGDPAKALCAEAERLDADLIVVGSVRTQGVGRVLGSVAGDVLRRAPCSVLVAKTT